MANAPSAERSNWLLFLPLRGWTPSALGGDLAAGLTLAAIAIPEQMATARLGGLSPTVGLVAFVAATLGFAIFGASRRLSAGADSTITPIFAGALAALATLGSPRYVELATALALLVGSIVALSGLLKLGWIADFLSRPVITGFLAGIAAHIVLSQAPALLGLPEESGDVYHRLAAMSRQLGAFNPIALAIGVAVLAATLGAEKLNPRIPGALIGLVGATLASRAFGLAGLGVAVLGVPSGGLPPVGVPALGLETALPLVGLAGVISLVVMVQTGATSRSFPDDGEADVDRDYVGVGVGGVLAALAGAFPVNASPPRTAAVAAAGGRTQVAGLAAAAAVAALALFGAGLMAETPTAALAGVLFFVAQRIFHGDDLMLLMRRAPGEFALAVLTMLFIVLLPIQTGVAIGMFLSLVHGVYTITRVRLIPFRRTPGTTVWWPIAADHPGETAPGVLVLGFQAPLSFLNAYSFRRDALQALAPPRDPPKLVVLESSGIVEIDFTAAAILNEVIDEAHARRIDFAVARLESVRAEAAFKRFGVLEHLGEGRVFPSVEGAIRTLAPAG
ncbi:MAG TPA: SulP family inorganic anion transporter [Caulobacteraceae bacterium]|nr:SulP family inorganic anion transporter [Caulobacteraceae bacterium]